MDTNGTERRKYRPMYENVIAKRKRFKNGLVEHVKYKVDKRNRLQSELSYRVFILFYFKLIHGTNAESVLSTRIKLASKS